MRYADPVDDARSIAVAARALARAVKAGRGVESAADRLERNARRAVDRPERGFAPGPEPSHDEMLADALAQLSIGAALCQAHHTVETGGETARLDATASALDTTAELVENLGAAPTRVFGFDSQVAQDRTIVEAAHSTLDTMGSAAADVMTAILDDVAKPIIDKVPATLREHFDGDLPGRIAGLALRAVRRGLELLHRLVPLEIVERIRADIDDVLARLGHGEDSAVLAGWVIGVPAVRAGLAEPDDDAGADLRQQLDDLGVRFVRLCKLLRRIGLVIAGLATALALINITLPHAGAVTAVGLVLVVGAVIVFGRDHTGATDLPGPVRGVRLLFEGARHAPA